MDYELVNNGQTAIRETGILGGDATNGVMLATPVPFRLQDLDAGGPGRVFTLRYLVPVGVERFRATI